MRMSKASATSLLRQERFGFWLIAAEIMGFQEESGRNES
jgi:hypothetical protein